MFGAPPGAGMHVYAVAGRLGGVEGAEIHVDAVAGRFGEPRDSLAMVWA